jgi:hypothetical protein
MLWVTVSILGFFLMTALVIAVARSGTARWERENRATNAPRPDEAGARARRARGGARLRAELTRRGATVGCAVVRIRPTPQAAIRMLAVGRVRARGLVLAVGRTGISRRSAARHPGTREAGAREAGARVRPAVREGADGAAPPAPAAPDRRARARRGLRRGARRPDLAPGPGRLPRRLAVRFLHRRDRQPDPQEPRVAADGGTTTP